MNNCLSCGEKVENKYCNVSCQNKHRKEINEIEYNKAPKHCLQCESIINYDNKRNKFCNLSCSNKFNITKKNKFDLISDKELESLFQKSLNIKEFFNLVGYDCNISSNLKKIGVKRLTSIGLDLDDKKYEVKDLTKKELFNKRANWQSARSYIVKNAKKVFDDNNKEYVCLICGYDIHCDIAHIKSVSEFDDNALVSEINNINNLEALCPNHHWEYDNKIIKLR